MTHDTSSCELLIKLSSQQDEWSCLLKPGGVATDLTENQQYLFSFTGTPISRFFIDDVEIHRTAVEGPFSWSADFFAGSVELAAIDVLGGTHQFIADVSPNAGKLGSEQFTSMFEEIRAFDAQLLLGNMAATAAFGAEVPEMEFSSFVALARLKQHGKAFLGAVAEITRKPHKFIQPVHRRSPLSAIRRLHPSALMDRRLVAIASGYVSATESMDSIQLLNQTALLSFDTPANRTMMALLMRFRASILGLIEVVQSRKLKQEIVEQELRMPRRLELLLSLRKDAEHLLMAHPFTDVSKPEITAAGLTHISSQPLYSRAYRWGTEALRSGVCGEKLKDRLNVSPTWGVFETWCFVHLLNALKIELDCEDWQLAKYTAAGADISFTTTLPNGARLEALFQAKFHSESPIAGRFAWSLSRERIPDIVFVITKANKRRFLVLDAKYRSGRSNVLEAMESAHIYHDSLRLSEIKASTLGAIQPDLCLLLLPGTPEVPSLDKEEFWDMHGVGTLAQFAHGQSGVERCVLQIQSWCDSMQKNIENSNKNGLIDSELFEPTIF